MGLQSVFASILQAYLVRYQHNTVRNDNPVKSLGMFGLSTRV